MYRLACGVSYLLVAATIAAGFAAAGVGYAASRRRRPRVDRWRSPSGLDLFRPDLYTPDDDANRRLAVRLHATALGFLVVTLGLVFALSTAPASTACWLGAAAQAGRDGAILPTRTMERDPRPDDLERQAAGEPPEPRGTRGHTEGTVKWWRDAQGYGAIATAATAPWDVWCHFSAVDLAGYKALTPGERVDVEYYRADQDSFRYIARRVRPLDRGTSAAGASPGAG